jgi:hypothetical protein
MLKEADELVLNANFAVPLITWVVVIEAGIEVVEV